MIGSLTISPRRRRCGLYCEFLRGRGVTQEDLIAHLRRLRKTLGCPLVVVLDNLNVHKGQRLRGWCERVKDVRLEYLPAYAPELNAVEAAWGHGKCVTAAGRTADDADELEALAREAIAAAGQQRLLRGFVRGTRLPFQFDLPSRRNPSGAQ
ncbi:hypothetical protein CA12_28710 [Alienimonas californiensis]|uniref:Tc1-like transposase DDE domain-containing protein n=1 Tax=Alienimonas californiensis TaxID=2527989 RepID=A0A517PBK3_9PLAN|nr:hypothetical protein CA12_28710 [Alienimonas californiensis]